MDRGPTTSAESDTDALEHRRASEAVRLYLEALERSKPRKGRRANSDSVHRRLETVRRQLARADVPDRAELLREEIDLEAELAAAHTVEDMEALELDFIEVAKAYSEREGISYSAWRAVGVDADLLRRADIRQLTS